MLKPGKIRNLGNSTCNRNSCICQIIIHYFQCIVLQYVQVVNKAYNAQNTLPKIPTSLSTQLSRPLQNSG